MSTSSSVPLWTDFLNSAGCLSIGFRNYWQLPSLPSSGPPDRCRGYFGKSTFLFLHIKIQSTWQDTSHLTLFTAIQPHSSIEFLPRSSISTCLEVNTNDDVNAVILRYKKLHNVALSHFFIGKWQNTCFSFSDWMFLGLWLSISKWNMKAIIILECFNKQIFIPLFIYLVLFGHIFQRIFI